MSLTNYKILGYLQIFVGMAAVAGAVPLILNPDGAAQGLSIDLLKGTPFPDFLVPGIILLLAVGAGSLIASWYSLRFKKQAAVLGITLGCVLIVWILAQIYLIGYLSFIQPMYLALGTIELMIGIRIFKRQKTGSQD